MTRMPYVTLSLSDKKKKQFEELALKEKRGKSNMLVVLLDYYLENHEQVKK